LLSFWFFFGVFHVCFVRLHWLSVVHRAVAGVALPP
jgi:hypothetical protein